MSSGTEFTSKDNQNDPRISKGQASYGSTVVSASNLLKIITYDLLLGLFPKTI